MSTKPNRSPLLLQGILLVVATLLLHALFGCGGDPVDLEPRIRPVRYQPVYATGGSRVRVFSGVAEAGIESKLSFKVAGTIERLNVTMGDAVSAGDEIGHLDDDDYRIRHAEPLRQGRGFADAVRSSGPTGTCRLRAHA